MTACAAEPADLEPLLLRVAQEVRLRRLQTPAIFFLEMCKPLCGVSAAAAVVSRPVLASFLGFKAVNSWERLFAASANLERLIELIEDPGLAEQADDRC